VGMNDYIAKPIDERLLYSKIVGFIKKPVLIPIDSDEKSGNDKGKKCIDLEYLMRRTKSNPKLMTEIISIYLEQTPPLIITMKQSFEDKDWKSLYAAVHKMIPSFAIMGISTDFENMAKKIQDYSSKLDTSNEIQEMVLQLETICEQACKELEEELNMIKKNNL
jgi:HPt (histidine-containing phosphotransfer) domain-containing protein